MRAYSFFSRRSIIALAVLTVLGLRSFVPVGYMPDFSASGIPTLMACDGIDHQSSSHHHHGSHSGHDHAGACPFSVGTVYGFDGIKTPLIVPPVYASATVQPAFSLLLSQHAAFGNASPRSPPYLS